MKHLLFIISILLCISSKNSVYAQIHGTYPKNNVSLSLLRISGAGQADTLENATTRNGQFQFKTRPQQADIYMLVMHDAGWTIPMLLEAGENRIHIPDLKTISVQSGELQKRADECNDKLKTLARQQAETTQRLQEEKDADKLQALQKEMQQIDAQYQELLVRYIRNNKDNMAGVFLVWDKMEWTDFQILEERYRLLDDNMQNTPGGKAIRKEIDRRWRLKPGIIARDFTIPDSSGQPVKLSDIRAKVKLLDFWASWCIPCRNANKKLISLYEKYKSKGLEIIGISVDKDENQWKRAIRQDSCNWIQLSELKSDENAIYYQYKVFSIPATFLLDEDNRCIATGLSEEDLEKMIRQMLRLSPENE